MMNIKLSVLDEYSFKCTMGNNTVTYYYYHVFIITYYYYHVSRITRVINYSFCTALIILLP